MQPIKKRILFQTLCSLFLIYNITHTADSDQLNDPQKITVTLDFINGANIERPIPTAIDKIDLAKKETNTGKTFGELREESTKKGLPWLITAALIFTQTDIIVDYFDTTKLIETQGKSYSSEIFRSHHKTNKLIHQSMAKLLKKLHPFSLSANQIELLYPHKQQLEQGVASTKYDCEYLNTPCYNIESNEISATLAITLCNNYTPALALQNGLLLAKNDNPKLTPNLNFWENFIQQLPKATYEKTQQEFLQLYSIKND